MIELIRSDKNQCITEDLKEKKIRDIKEKYKNKFNFDLDIVSIAVKKDEIILLDKENSLLRIINNSSDESKTIGSRMGYLSEQTKGRVGFEYPEDLTLVNNRILISDSGNCRILVLSDEYKYINDIELPDNPYKFILFKDGIALFSDFSGSVLFISLEFGYLGKITLGKNLDLSSIKITNDNVYVNDEEGVTYKFVFDIPDINEIAKYFNNLKILMNILIKYDDKPDREELRNLIKDNDNLIIEYIQKTDDTFFDDRISRYITRLINTVFSEDKNTINNIEKLALDYFFIYKILNTRGDQESGSLVKEQKIYEIFEIIKLRREKFQEILKIKDSIKNSELLNSVFCEELKKRKDELYDRVSKVFLIIDSEKSKIDDEELLKNISEYWLLYDEIKILFPDLKNDDINFPILTNVFYNQTLKDFYFNISKLFLKSNELEQFYTYAEKELALYSDKINIMFNYVDILIGQSNYERALSILARSTDQNIENLNRKYYKIYKARNEIDKAFAFLKKELELFPHKKELIHELISLNIMTDEEISKILKTMNEKGEQIIDTNFNSAMVLLELDENDKGNILLNRELELFPENKKAVLLKMKLMLGKYPHIQKEEGLIDFQILINYLKTISGESNVVDLFNYLSILSFIPFSNDIIVQLESLNMQFLPENFIQEINKYMSFYKYIKKRSIKKELDKFDREEYLSSLSCSYIALEHYFEEAKRYFKNKDTEKGFELLESILKYNPGNKRIFDYLDTLEQRYKD